MEILVPALFFLTMVICIPLGIRWSLNRAGRMVDKWAEAEGLGVVSRKPCFFFRGPFWWRSSENHIVFHVVVRDQRGEEFRGWVRCGGWFRGIWKNEVAVRWDSRGSG